MKKGNTYHSYTENELVQAICSGNEEAAVYLIYNRYYRDLRYLCFDYCGSHEYIDDLCQDVYLLLKGKNGDWQPLTTWTGLSSFRTWLNSVVQHFLLKKRDDLIGLREKKLYSENEDDIDPVEKVESVQPSAEENMNKVFLVEAIRRIPNPDQKLVILKELQGYSHREIADILNSVRRREGRVKRNALGEEILADGAAVDVLKQRAMEFLKKELGHLKK